MPRVIGVADNYRRPSGVMATAPLVFLKDLATSHADGDLVPLPDAEDRYWGEPELAFVIGRRAWRVPQGRAHEHIAHYRVANDVTREGPAGHDHHLMYSKAFAGSLVLGAVVPVSTVSPATRVRGYHNDTLLREGTLAERVFDDDALLAWLSAWFALEPGDVVLTGAPNRVRDRLYLADGDTYVCDFEGVGRLTNAFTFGAGA